jgi:hypothetical protein
MDFTDAHRTRMEHKAAAHVTGHTGPPPLTDAMLPPLMAAAPWLAADHPGTAPALHMLNGPARSPLLLSVVTITEL